MCNENSNFDRSGARAVRLCGHFNKLHGRFNNPLLYLYIDIYIDLIMLNFLLHKFRMELHVMQLLMCGQICAGSNWYGFRDCEQQGVH